jgi:signal peptidase I
MQFMQITTRWCRGLCGLCRRLVHGPWRATFALLLFLATVVTGAYWLAERLVFPARGAGAAQALEAGRPTSAAPNWTAWASQVDGDVPKPSSRC